MLRLHDYAKASAAYRVRLALSLKNLDYTRIDVPLNEGAQSQPEHLSVNPQGLVPALEIDGHTLTQSLAIIEYLEETRPLPPLLPKDPASRTLVRRFAGIIACDTHPIINLRVQKYLGEHLGATPEQKTAWYAHWMRLSFEALEPLARQHGNGRFCFGDAPTLADCCLIPQLFGAKRFGVPVDNFPTLTAIGEHCNSLEKFSRVAPAL